MSKQLQLRPLTTEEHAELARINRAMQSLPIKSSVRTDQRAALNSIVVRGSKNYVKLTNTQGHKAALHPAQRQIDMLLSMA